MSEIQEKLRKFNQERDWDQFHSPENLAKSISIEAGELLECFQWDGEHFNLEDVKGELADVLTYCYMLADKLRLDPITIMEEKLKISEKKYPVSKCKGKSTKYDKL